MPGENWKAPKLMPRSGGMRSLKSKAGVTGLCHSPNGSFTLYSVPQPVIWEDFLRLSCPLFILCMKKWPSSWGGEGGLTLQFLMWSLTFVPTVSLSPLSWAPASAQPPSCPGPGRAVDPACPQMGTQELHNCTCTFQRCAVLEALGAAHVPVLCVGSAEQPQGCSESRVTAWMLQGHKWAGLKVSVASSTVQAVASNPLKQSCCWRFLLCLFENVSF